LSGSKKLAVELLYGTGGKDRRVMLPKSLVSKLKAQIQKVKLIHEQDLAEGFGEVLLRAGMSKRREDTAKDFRWQWLFPQKKIAG